MNTSLCLNFIIRKMGTMKGLTSWGFWADYMSTVLGTVPGTEEALSKCFSRLLLLFYYHCCCHLLSPGKAQQASTGVCRKDAVICPNREREGVSRKRSHSPRSQRRPCCKGGNWTPRSPALHSDLTPPPSPCPHLQASAPPWSWQQPQQPAVGQGGRGWGALGAARGVHTGEAARVRQPQAACAGRVGQAAAGLWRAASGALPGRPPLLRGCQRRGSAGAANASQPAGERPFSLPPIVTFQNRDSPAHSLPRKTRVAAAIIRDVHLSFAHPPPTLPASPVDSL